MSAQKTYSKEELLAMMPEEIIPNLFDGDPTRVAIENLLNQYRQEIASALADKLQKPVGLSLSDCNKIVGIVSDLLSPLLTQKSREYMAAIIYEELKKGE